MPYLISGAAGVFAGGLANIVVFYMVPGEKSISTHLKSYFEKAQYILTVIFLAAAFISFNWIYGFSTQFLSSCLVTVILTTAAWMDRATKIIPDPLVVIGALLGIAVLFLHPAATFMETALGAVIIGGILLVVSLISKGALGLGDVKLISCMAIYLGLERVLTGLAAAFLISGGIGLVILIKNHETRKKQIPFAPFLLAGTIIALIS